MSYITIETIFLCFLGLAGMFDTYYLYRHKKSGEVLACRIGHKCGSVVTSQYAKTLGIDNTILGGLFYTGILSVNILALLGFRLPAGLMLVVSGGAFIFSWYLISIMKFKLKEWCDWCLASATFSNLIFFTYLCMYLAS